MRNKVKMAALAGIILGLGFLAYDFFNWKTVPEEFNQARAAGVLIGQNIVRLSSRSLEGLEQISQLEQAGKYQEAISIVTKAIDNNRQAREEAFRLSRELEKMVVQLDKIEPLSARELATSAIGHEINLINQLINYNDFLLRLFSLLNQKFNGQLPQNPDGQVKELLTAINGQAEIINDLNKKFNDTMAEFDRL